MEKFIKEKTKMLDDKYCNLFTTYKGLRQDIVQLIKDSSQLEPQVINTPERFAPTLAEITKQGELGKQGWWEVVYHDGAKWQSFAGSDTFDDGEKVVKWKLCRECL